MADPAVRRDPSPLEAALERVGDRWSLLIVEALLDGPRRFNELGEAVSGIAPNILTDRLRRLERERIVVATPYQQRPPRMSYALTADGHDLASALRLLADWGARGAGEGPSRLRHGRAARPWRRAGTARPARSPSKRSMPTRCGPSKSPGSPAVQPAGSTGDKEIWTSTSSRMTAIRAEHSVIDVHLDEIQADLVHRRVVLGALGGALVEGRDAAGPTSSPCRSRLTFRPSGR